MLRPVSNLTTKIANEVNLLMNKKTDSMSVFFMSNDFSVTVIITQ